MHKCNMNGPGVIYNSRVFFREVTPNSDQYYQINKHGQIVKHKHGLNAVFSVEQVQDELEFSSGGGITNSCTCSTCGAIAAIESWKESILESIEIRNGNINN